jgi:hypothetical protein
MKKILVILLIIFCFGLCFGTSQSLAETKRTIVDGFYWNKQVSLWKLGFIEGWIDAGIVATEKIPSAFILSQLYDKKEGKITINRRPLDYIGKYYYILVENTSKQEGLEFYDFTYGQIMETIDKVYSDPRLTKWEIKEIMPLVRGRLKEGWTERDLDEVIAFQIKLNEYIKKADDKGFQSKSQEQEYLNELWKEEPKALKSLKIKYRISSDDFKP